MDALVSGQDIGALMRSEGPIVKAVLLRSSAAKDDDDGDAKPSASNDKDTDRNGVELNELIEEIEIDTTPKKAMVSQILGGPFTFLGQYEEEGIMVMIRRPTDSMCSEESDSDNEEEEDDVEAELPINPHKLQPPLHKKQVKGDILLMRVAAEEDEEEEEAEEEIDAKADSAAVTGPSAQEHKPEDADATVAEEKKEAASEDIPSDTCNGTGVATGAKSNNDDFFLDYTKEEYLKFAAKDIPEYDVEEEEEEEEEAEAEADSEGSDEEFALEDMDEDDEDDEDAQVGMMNLIFGQILRRFREEQGRGPDTRELLEMRSALAERLGVDVPPIDGADWDEKAPKSPGGKKLGGTPKKEPSDSANGEVSNGDDASSAEATEQVEQGIDEDADKKPHAENSPADEKITDATNDGVLNGDAVETTKEESVPESSGEKRCAELSPENSDDNSEERARKRVKFLPKDQHKVHVVDRVITAENSDDEDSSDEDYVDGGDAMTEEKEDE